MTDITNEVGPGNAVGSPHKPWMSNGAERLADVGRIGYITLSRDQDGSSTGRISCISEVGVGGGIGTGTMVSGGFRYRTEPRKNCSLPIVYLV